MKLNKFKKNLKGMTLIEVIVALAVFAIMALMLATMFATAMKMSLETHTLNSRVDKQTTLIDSGGENNLVSNPAASNAVEFNDYASGTNYSTPKISIMTINGKSTLPSGAPNPDYDPNQPNLRYFVFQP